MVMISGVANGASFYLIRHAEKQSGDDPGLTVQGQQRAQHIASILSLSDIKAVYSTDYQRTRLTAQPIAEIKNLKVQIYDPKELQKFADELLKRDISAVIVGHSNTTPQLAHLLSGESVSEMDENSFNLIYQVVTFPETKQKQTALNVLNSD